MLTLHLANSNFIDANKRSVENISKKGEMTVTKTFSFFHIVFYLSIERQFLFVSSIEKESLLNDYVSKSISELKSMSDLIYLNV